MASSPSDLDLVLDNGRLISPESARVSLDYMRSSSPESGSPVNINGGSFSKPVFIAAPSSNSGSPCLLSCPPSWLFQDAQGEHDNLHPEVPLSSSPPDITSSSPRSFGSKESQNASSSATSASLESLSDYASPSPNNPSLVDFVPVPSTEGFGQQLHRLLYIALKERGIDSSPSNSFAETSHSGSPFNRPLENGSTVNGTHPTTLSAGSSPALTSKWFPRHSPQIVSKLAMVQEFFTPPIHGPFPLPTNGATDEMSPIAFGSTNSKYTLSSLDSQETLFIDSPKAQGGLETLLDIVSSNAHSPILRLPTSPRLTTLFPNVKRSINHPAHVDATAYMRTEVQVYDEPTRSHRSLKKANLYVEIDIHPPSALYFFFVQPLALVAFSMRPDCPRNARPSQTEDQGFAESCSHYSASGRLYPQVTPHPRNSRENSIA